MRESDGPAYMRLVRVLALGVDSGELRAGTPLPSQRQLAQHLGLHFTTVTRAYAEAKRRGLIAAQPGRGTTVSTDYQTALVQDAQSPRPEIDLASVWPPALRIPFDLATALVALGGENGVALFSERAYRRDPSAIAPAVQWLQPRFAGTLLNRVATAAGARAALMALMRLEVGTSGVLLAEEMAWPTIRVLAAMFDIRVEPVAMDAHGIVPSALEDAMLRTGAKALYCVPNAQNPSNATMPLERRQAIADIAERQGLRIFEDDVYGELLEQPVPPIASLAPRQTYYIASLSKCLSPSLRVAYVVSPSVQQSRALDDLLRTTMLSPSPIVGALAIQALRDKSAFRHIARVRAEGRMRAAIAAEILREFRNLITVGPLSIWLRLPAVWTPAAFVDALAQRGVGILAGDAFAVGEGVSSNAVRIATGSARNQAELRTALQCVADLLGAPP
ncbi:PLP-dependent aminotransferase family protein [Pigmentiphaga aceris]|nr:PLP-dependent aminotransferase family protein [Pigmentiphaga aceris]